MATLMEKDVLIEVVASGLGAISRRLDYQDFADNEDRKKLGAVLEQR